MPAGAGKVGIQTEIQTGTGVDRSGHKADNGRKTQVEIASLFPSDTEADEALEIVKNDRYEITENLKKSPGNSVNAGADAKTAGDSVSLSMRNNGRENRLDHAGEQADQADQEATIPVPVVPVHAEHNGLNGIAGTRYRDSSPSSPSSPSGTPGTSDSRNNESEHQVHHSDFEGPDEKTEVRSNFPFRSNTGVSDQDTEAVKPGDFPPDNPNHCRDDRVNGVNEELCGLSTSVIDAEKTADSVCLFRSDNEPHREEDNVEITAVGTSGTSVNDAENNSDSVCLFRLDNEPGLDAENFETTTPDSVCLFRSNTASTQPDDETGFSDSSSVEVIDAVDAVDAFDEVEMVEVEDPDAAAEACGSVPDEPDLASLDGIRLSNPADKTEGTGAVEPDVPVEAEALSGDHSDESSHGSSHESPEAETNWARIYGDDALLDPEESEAASRMFTERLKLAQRSGSSAGPAGSFAQPAVPVSIPVRLPLKPIDGLAVHHEQGAAEGKEYAYKDFDADGNEIRNAVDRSDDQAANQVNPVNRHAADSSRESSVHAEQGDPEGAGSYGRPSDALFDGNGTDVPAANSVNSVNTEDFDFADEYAETWNAAGAAESNSKPKTVTVEINAENGTTMTIIAPVAPPKRSDGSQESQVRQISQIRQVTESGPQVETLPVRNERVRHEHGAQTAPTGEARVPGVPGATDVTGAAGITGAAVNGPSVAKSPSPFDGNLSDPDMPAARSSSAGRGKFPGTAAIVRSVIGTDDEEDEDGRKRAPRRSARNIPLSTVADSLMPTPDASDAHAGIELPLTRSEVARNKRVAAAGARSADPAEGLLAEIRSALETRSGPLWSEPVEDSPEGVYISPEKFFARAAELGLTKPRIVQVINSLWQPDDFVLAFKVVKSTGKNVRLIGLQKRR